VPSDDAIAVARSLLASPRSSPSAWAPATRCASRPACASTATTSTPTTTPVEAVLLWSVGKERRVQGGFPGAAVIQKQIAEGSTRKRVGLLPEGKAIAREGAEIVIAGKTVGIVTSGGFSPTLGRAVAMGYVERSQSANGTKVDLMVRGKPVPAEIVPMPFVKHAYYRG
jgi:aminomethyltransferase